MVVVVVVLCCDLDRGWAVIIFCFALYMMYRCCVACIIKRKLCVPREGLWMWDYKYGGGGGGNI